MTICVALQRVYLAFRQVAELARTDAIVADRADADAFEAADRMTHGFTHAAHLTVATFMNHDREQGVGTVRRVEHLLNADGRRSGSVAVERDPFSQTLECPIVGDAPDANVILAADAMTRMCEALGEFAVAREYQ